MQDNIVYGIIGLTLARVGVQLYRMLSPESKVKTGCGGCEGCEMKRSLVKHGRP